MCRHATVLRTSVHLRWLLGLVALGLGAFAQEPARNTAALRPAWRPIGNSVVELVLSSPATGPMDRVWYSEDGSRLFARNQWGKVFETLDFETWIASPAEAPAREDLDQAPLESTFGAGAGIRGVLRFGTRSYALGRNLYRSDDGGRHWVNLTQYRQDSIIGTGMRDLVVSPVNPDEIVVANDYGVWRSADGGISWSGLNLGLPNLPVRRLLGTPAGGRGVSALLDGIGPAEWAPGEKQAWRRVADPRAMSEQVALGAARTRLGAAVSTIAASGEFIYAGAKDGRIWVSTDRGQNWRLSRQAGPGSVESISVDALEPRLALVALGVTPGAEERPRVLRTINAGVFWDDLTASLPDGDAHGIAGDRSSGAIYVATDRGLFLTFGDLLAAAPATRWIPVVGGLPEAPAADVLLDPAGNQVYVAVQGYGVYAAPAPHRFRSPQVVNAADFSSRPAAPGSLLTVLGARIVKAQAGVLEAPVLHSSDLESQIQVPFEASGPRTRLSLDVSRGSLTFDLPVQPVSPAIFVDADGAPLLLDGDSGTVLDAMNPARANARVQILTTGLGRVRPDWPTGMAAPLEEPPQVIATVRAFLDREPVEVTRATLAPGFVGFYLVEIQLPAIVNMGPAELFLQAGGQDSNRVRLYVEP
jgi:uncharacterized protein (TIGR03437 family)